MKEAIQLNLFTVEELSALATTPIDADTQRKEWRKRKLRLGIMRVDLSRNLEKDGNGYPIVKPYYGIPDAPLINFKEALATENHNHWVHFFIDDCLLEQIWIPQYTERDLEILSRFKGTFTPDFTLAPQLELCQQQFNVFRNRAIGQLLQKRGQRVIPTVGWSCRNSFDFCFLGLSQGGTVAISTNGVLRKFVSHRLFLEGVFEMERQLHPDNIVIVGQKMELRTKASQLWYPNEQIMRLRGLHRNGIDKFQAIQPAKQS